ncbi:MAG: hypothetical protein ABW173_04085 [Sphingomonas sp.]
MTLDDLFASPDHYLHSFEGDAALFVPMDRAAYHRSIFLDHRIAPAREGAMRLPFATLAGRRGKALATGWILHVAHCGSTLLARALDDLATNLVLREPLALRQLALAPDAAALAITLDMLGKRYADDLPTIVKANVPVNFALPHIAAHDPNARAIMLHLSLPDYVGAILRTDRHRAWLRRVTEQLAPHLGDLSTLGDAERVAALWLAQTRAFANALAAMPHARVLDAERFFAAPAATLAAAAAHLGVPRDGMAISEIVAGPLFATYSKDPSQPFDNAARLAARAEAGATLAEEMARATAWVAARGDAGATAALAARPLA